MVLSIVVLKDGDYGEVYLTGQSYSPADRAVDWALGVVSSTRGGSRGAVLVWAVFVSGYSGEIIFCLLFSSSVSVKWLWVT